MQQITGRLDNWTDHRVVDGIYYIWGDVSGDIKGRFPDGSRMHTSVIMGEVGDHKAGDIVKTMYSTYLLGERL